MTMDLAQSDIKQLQGWTNYFSYQRTPIFRRFINCDAKFKCLFTANQFGKTASVAYSYVMRFLGHHPVASFNVDYYLCPKGHKTAIPAQDMLTMECRDCGEKVEMFYEPIRTFRFASESVPMAGGNEEVKNTQYPELMKWLPPELVEKDITARNPMMTIKDINGGPPMRVVFVGYHQTQQSQAGVQLKSCWLDEESPPDLLEEQYPRLLAADGDIVFSMTFANRMSYMFDEYYIKARKYYRSQTIVDKYNVPEVEVTASTKDIVVFQAATDDNPTLSVEAIDAIFEHIDDEDVIAIRRYGTPKHVTGRIFKKFDPRVHVVDGEELFPQGLPDTFMNDFGQKTKPWLYARALDYHEHVDWHAVWVAMSPDNEVFVFNEMKMSPEHYTSKEMAWEMCAKSGDHKYMVDRVDALAQKKQVNTGTSAIDDLNRYFYEFKREGNGNGAYWQSWDTRSKRGRDEIRMRLNNSLKVGKPFNNEVVEDSMVKHLPTLWIFNNCNGIAQHMKMWRLEEWKERDAVATKDQKEKPQQKWSHYCMCLEGLFKDAAFQPRGIRHKSPGRLNDKFRRKRHA